MLATATLLAAAVVVLLHRRKRRGPQKAVATNEIVAAEPTPAQPTPAEPAPTPALLVATVPSSSLSADFACLDISSDNIPQWPGEPIVVWYRRVPGTEDCEVFAMQEACPHASISLVESDIEDLRAENVGKLSGPCISCPAHSYVFDLGSGKCLTNRETPDARTYPAWAEPTPSGDAVRILVRPERHPPNAPGPPPLSQQEANSIQLEMVDRALRRRFGDEEEDDDVFDDGAVQGGAETGT